MNCHERWRLDAFQSYTETIAEKLAKHYGREDVFTGPQIKLERRPEDQDRSYTAIHHNGVYTAYEEDVSALSDELKDSYEAEKLENSGVNLDILAKHMYVGLALSGTLIHHELARVGRNANSVKRGQMMRDFFGNHDDITESIRSVFCEDPEFAERAFMTDNLTDERAFAINGLRMRMLYLFKAYETDDYLGVDEKQLQELGRGHMRRIYARDGATFTGVSVVLGQHPSAGDKVAFSAMPDWAIAAAYPLREPRVLHLLSQPWQE